MVYKRQTWNKFKFVIVFLVLKQGCFGSVAGEHFLQSDTFEWSDLLWETYLIDRAPSSDTWCQYRDNPQHYNKEVFRLQSSFGCYFYTNPSRFNPDVKPYNVSTNRKDGFVYQLVMIDGVKYNVDYRDEDSVALISKSLLAPEDTRKWLACSGAAEECCQFMMDNPNTQAGCPATWDAWYCWHESPADTIQHGVCSYYIYSGSAPLCNHKSSKECFPNATWNVDTDYSSCDIRPRIQERTIYHVAMLSTALIVSLPAIVIFFSYKKLRNNMRQILTRNLLIVIGIRNILTIISKITIILDAVSDNSKDDSVMNQNGVGCKILAVLEKLATNAVFACMLLLGVYLHGLIATALKGEPKMWPFFIVAAVLCSLPVVCWTVVTALLNNQFCWTVDENGYQWINDSVKIAMLAINMVLIIDIIRVLLTKFVFNKTVNDNDIRRTTKVTILLLPVFGVQFVFTASRPNTTNCTGEQVFYYFSYGLDGLQGAVVSLFFCYLNSEVQQLVCKTMRNLRMRFDKNYVPPNSDNSRRVTQTTTVDHGGRNPSTPPPRVSSLQPPGQDMQPASTVGTATAPDLGFFTPSNSVAGSPATEKQFYYSPRSSLAGSSSLDGNLYHSPRSSLAGASMDVSFYDCFDNPNELFDDNTGTRNEHYKRAIPAPTRAVNCVPQSVTLGYLPPGKLDENLGYDNYSFSLSSENLPDDVKTVLRKRNASTEFYSEDTDV